MSVIEGGILLLVMVALYAFAAVFFLAMTYSPNPARVGKLPSAPGEREICPL